MNSKEKRLAVPSTSKNFASILKWSMEDSGMDPGFTSIYVQYSLPRWSQVTCHRGGGGGGCNVMKNLHAGV